MKIKNSVTKTPAPAGRVFKEQVASEKMSLFGSGHGFLGIGRSTQRGLKNALGLGILVFGFYLLLAFTNIVPFSSRFSFLSNKSSLLLTIIVLIVLGALINDYIRNIFRA